MLNQFHTHLKNTLRKIDRHFKYSQKEIARNNLMLLNYTALGGLLITTVLLCVTPLLMRGWMPTVGHWLLLVFFALYLLVGQLLARRKPLNYHMVHLVTVSFILLFWLLILCIDLVPYPSSAATIFTLAMAVMPVVFIVPFHEIVAMLVISFLVFVQANNLFILAECRGRNLFNGLLGMLCGILVGWMVTKIRAEDSKDRQDLLRESSRDQLTGIANKSTVEKSCFSYLEHSGAEPCALIVMDVDSFKDVNDRYGHHAGDEVLALCGEVIRQVFRGSDLCGRIGGDEFMVLMKNVANGELVRLKMQTLAATLDQEVFEKLSIRVTCSYGVVLKAEGEAIPYLSLFNMADKVLYRAKKSGKARGEVFTAAECTELVGRKDIMLVVDDSDLNRKVLRNIFEDDFEVVEAANGKDAVQIIEKHHGIIGIMMLDIMMPEMNGFDVLNWLAERGDISRFPVVAISSDEGKELKSLEMGVADMITKPFNPEVVRRRVQNALSRRDA